jgi:hypothetical protein
MGAYRIISCWTGCGFSVGGVDTDIGTFFSLTKIVPSGRTSTYSAPARFAARMVRAMSACVKAAPRRGIGVLRDG